MARSCCELSGRGRLRLLRCSLFLLCALDLAVSTLLLIRVGTDPPRETLVNQVVHYHFGVSSFDLWLLSVLRSLAFVGVVFVFCCKELVVLRWLRLLSPALVVAAMLTFCASVAKLLASFEFYEDGTPVYGGNVTDLNAEEGVSALSPCNVPNTSTTTIPACDISPSNHGQPLHPWLWGLLAWMSVAGVGYLVLYRALVSIKMKHLVRSRARRQQIQVDENTPLIQNAISDDDPVYTEAAMLEEEESLNKGKSPWKVLFQLLGYTKPDVLWYIGGCFFLVVGSAATSFIPYYTGQVINHIAISPSTSEFKQAIIVMSGITVVSAVCAGLRAGLLIIAHGRLNVRIRNRLFASLIRQEIGFFDQSETGDLTSRLTSDTTKMADQIGIQLNLFIRTIIQSLGSIVFMVKLTWKLSTVTLVGIPIITVVTKYYGVIFKNISRAIQDSLAKANNVAEETLSSMRTVRSFANEASETQLFREKLNLTFKIYQKKAWAYGTWMSNNQLLQLVLQVVTLYYGGHLVINREMSGGELVSLLLYQVSLAASLDAMSTVFTGIMDAVGAAEKVLELIERQPGINHDSGQLQPEKLEGVVEFKNVSFAYPTRPDVEVLKNVSFTAQPGEVIALVGPSGGGKSSCINLLERFYEPCSGEVLLDGRRLSEYDHKFLHTHMSLVGQEPVLYARSITENIKYGVTTEAPHEVVQHAAEMANAHDFICDLTGGYDTQTGEKGVQLSGGQKQRVAIARALIQNPTILLLDEATSALDAESEHLVQQALNSNFKGRTVIVIAHRLSTVERADRIIVINKGRVLEQGTHQKLLEEGGLYAKLVRKQMVQHERKERRRTCSQVHLRKKVPLPDDDELVDESHSQDHNPHSDVLEALQDSEDEFRSDSVFSPSSSSSVNSMQEQQ